MHRIALAMSLTLVTASSDAPAQTLHFPQPTPSPRIEALRIRLVRGDTAAVVAEFSG